MFLTQDNVNPYNNIVYNTDIKPSAENAYSAIEIQTASYNARSYGRTAGYKDDKLKRTKNDSLANPDSVKEKRRLTNF